MVPTEAITEERLARWKKRLAESHATPVALIGIGHDHVSRQRVLCTVEDIPLDQLRELLLGIARDLDD
jgi:hypothetical protein